MLLNWERSKTHPRIVEARMPPWQVNPGVILTDLLVWIEPRPDYCDRGRYIAKTDAPLDAQEGWPRYYFSLRRAKKEIQAWLDVRVEARHGP